MQREAATQAAYPLTVSQGAQMTLHRVQLTCSLVASLIAASASGCESSTLEDPRSDQSDVLQAADEASVLTQVSGRPAPKGCDALNEVVRERAIAEMKERLAQARSFDGRGCILEGVPGVSRSGNAPSAVPSPRPPGTAGGPTSVSDTNNQVAGVDEADLVKTNAGTMYLATGNALHVLSAWPAASTREIARVPLKGKALKLFVEGGRAVVYAALGGSNRPACTYGYDCAFTGDGSRTQITVFDVRDPAAPRVLREVALSGSLIAARRIGSAVHTVVSDLPRFEYPMRPPNLPSTCAWNRGQQEKLPTAAEIDAAYKVLERENEALIRKLDLSAFMPKIEDTAGLTSGDCTSHRGDLGPTGLAFTTVHSFDLSSEQKSRAETVVSRPGATYVSEEHLYIAVTDTSAADQRFGRPVPGASGERSAIHSFRLASAPPRAQYEASGSVKGHVLNQFAMDEWNGALRIATTSGQVPDPDVSSTISVLKQDGKTLNRIGELGQLAPSEDIRSVRFVGSKGYVVTFKKTDPLFVFDLTVAHAPKLLGELKIPGFSTYMHPLDEQNLLTIGYDADDQGSFAYFSGVLIQIFDVSDPRNPKLRHKRVIGTRGSSSEALTNHLAFNYFADRKLLALPMTICDGGQAGSFGTHMTFSGLMLFDVDLGKGIDERGRVAHPPVATGRYNDASCSNWWTNASSEVKRSVFMDDFVYSIAEDVVRVQSLAQLGSDVASVLLQPAVSPQQ
jgi:hypothetical protein